MIFKLALFLFIVELSNDRFLLARITTDNLKVNKRHTESAVNSLLMVENYKSSKKDEILHSSSDYSEYLDFITELENGILARRQSNHSGDALNNSGASAVPETTPVQIHNSFVSLSWHQILDVATFQYFSFPV